MLQYAIWGISFVTLWLAILWLNFLYEKPNRKPITALVTIGIPVFSKNKDKDPIKTLKSVYESGYPAKLLDVIIIDDGSKDDVADRLRKFQKTHPEYPFRLCQKENGGKASALNLALKHAKGQYFAVIDADSRIGKDSIELSLSNFTNNKVGAVISRIRVEEPKNFLERMQRIEYIMSAMIRKIMSNFGTLSMTPGVLSVYRTELIRKAGGFTTDRNNMTEDLEIAMRLKYRGYDIMMEPESVTYTDVPNNFSSLWRQRIRWTRGYIYNHWNYRKMFFSSKHGLFGVFQMPINVMAILLLMLNVGIISYDLLERLIDFIFRSITIPGYFIDTITSIPTLQEFILARNVQISLPIIIAFILGIYLIIFAHRFYHEQFKKQFTPLITYIIIMPYFCTINWFSAIINETTRTKRKW